MNCWSRTLTLLTSRQNSSENYDFSAGVPFHCEKCCFVPGNKTDSLVVKMLVNLFSEKYKYINLICNMHYFVTSLTFFSPIFKYHSLGGAQPWSRAVLVKMCSVSNLALKQPKTVWPIKNIHLNFCCFSAKCASMLSKIVAVVLQTLFLWMQGRKLDQKSGG